jgi:hypothetical protein
MSVYSSECSERDWVEDFSYENGNYENRCCRCMSLFIGHKRRVVCKICADVPQSPLTPEELAELGKR